MTNGPQPALVDALARAALTDYPRVSELLRAVAEVVGTEEIAEDGALRRATPTEIAHARALMTAFMLHLDDDTERRAWTINEAAGILYAALGSPVALEETSEDVVEVWQAYASQDIPPFVIAHLAHLLACRRIDVPESVDRAVGALCELRDIAPDSYTPGYLSRALALTRMFNRPDLQASVELELLANAADELTGDFRLGVFVHSLEPLIDGRLQTQRVTDLLDQALLVCGPDSHALVDLHDLRRRLATDDAGRADAERRGIQALLDHAGRDTDGLRKAVLIRNASERARAFGHLDLAARALEMERGIPKVAFDLKAIPIDLPVTQTDIARRALSLVGRDDLLSALRRIASACPTGDIDDVRTRAAAGEGTGTFDAIFSTIVLNQEMLVKGGYEGDSDAAAVARLQDIRLMLSLPVIGQALDLLQFKYEIDDPTLPTVIAETSGLTLPPVSKLVRCLERYWRGDTEAASYIGTSLIEGLLRERLLQAGLDPYNPPTGDRVGKYKTLGLMLAIAEGVVLSASWSSFMTHTLTDPLFGLNLRNELSHGAANGDPGDDNAALILLACLHLAVGVSR